MRKNTSLNIEQNGDFISLGFVRNKSLKFMIFNSNDSLFIFNDKILYNNKEHDINELKSLIKSIGAPVDIIINQIKDIIKKYPLFRFNHALYAWQVFSQTINIQFIKNYWYDMIIYKINRFENK